MREPFEIRVTRDGQLRRTLPHTRLHMGFIESGLRLLRLAQQLAFTAVRAGLGALGDSIDVVGTRRQVTTSAGVTLNARRFDDGVGASIDTLVVPGAPAEALSSLRPYPRDELASLPRVVPLGVRAPGVA